MKHSPGKWLIRSDEQSNYWVGPSRNTDPETITGIIKVMADHPMEQGEARANAHLVAAAPKMFEACLAVRKWLGPSTDEATEKIGHLLDAVIAEVEAGQVDWRKL